MNQASREVLARLMKGRKILGTCDGEILFLWYLMHMPEDGLTEGHAFRRDEALWGHFLALVDGLDARFGLFDYGELDGTVCLHLGPEGGERA